VLSLALDEISEQATGDSLVDDHREANGAGLRGSRRKQ
jgi:hypothetical protein